MAISQPQPSYDELVARVAHLRQSVLRLEDRVKQLEAELAAERRRNHDDKGPPPPSPAPFSKPQRKLNPKPPGRKPGQGRFERRRAPVPTEPPVDVAPPQGLDCPHCGAQEQLRPFATELPTITELPPPVPRVRQFRRPVLRCRCCERLVRGQHPELAPHQHGANSHQFGPRAKAAMLILYGSHGVPVNQVPAILETLTGITTTPSTIVQLAQQATSAGEPLGEAAAKIRAEVAASDATYMDATGWRVKGEKAQLVGVEGFTGVGVIRQKKVKILLTGGGRCVDSEYRDGTSRREKAVGNHSVGRAMAAGVRAYLASRKSSKIPSRKEALKIIDILAEPWRGADAEFDDEDFLGHELGNLIAIAFGWDGGEPPPDHYDSETHEDFWDKWHTWVNENFRKRYEFC